MSPKGTSGSPKGTNESPSATNMSPSGTNRPSSGTNRTLGGQNPNMMQPALVERDFRQFVLKWTEHFIQRAERMVEASNKLVANIETLQRKADKAWTECRTTALDSFDESSERRRFRDMVSGPIETVYLMSKRDAADSRSNAEEWHLMLRELKDMLPYLPPSSLAGSAPPVANPSGSLGTAGAVQNNQLAQNMQIARQGTRFGTFFQPPGVNSQSTGLGTFFQPTGVNSQSTGLGTFFQPTGVNSQSTGLGTFFQPTGVNSQSTELGTFFQPICINPQSTGLGTYLQPIGLNPPSTGSGAYF